MYPLYWTPSKEGILMRYSYEYKKECIELYRQGKWAETPKGIKKENFKKMARQWVRMEDANGPEVLKHKSCNKVWTQKEKLNLITQVIADKSYKSVAIENGIYSGTLYQWVHKYKVLGYNGLVNNKKG